jgi:putative endonuclease
MDRCYFVYILASKRYGTLYVGVTNDVTRRTWEHKQKLVEGFTKKYGVHMLVYYETFTDVVEAIAREKRLKRWHRTWKIELIQRQNPEWRDLYDDLVTQICHPGQAEPNEVGRSASRDR